MPETQETKPTEQTLESVLKEKAALEQKLKDVEPLLPKVKQVLDAEEKRKEDEKKKAEEKALKDKGAEKILAEKNGEIEAISKRLAEYEAKEKARIDEMLETLPEDAKEVVLPLKDKLSLNDFASIVEKQIKITQPKGDQEKSDTLQSKFLNPSTTSKPGSKYELTAKGREILESLGRDTKSAEIMFVNRAKDEESGAMVSKFTRHIQPFFSDMSQPIKHKLAPNK